MTAVLFSTTEPGPHGAAAVDAAAVANPGTVDGAVGEGGRDGSSRRERSAALVVQVRELVSGLDAAVLDVELAKELVADLGRVERIAAAGVAIAAKRVADSNAWCAEGDRSAAHWVARQTGVAVGSAQAALDTTARLENLPGTDAAVRSGELSAAQAQQVADAATADPAQERRLIATAAETGLHGLRAECAKVKAVAAPDPEARHMAIRRSRRFSHWTDSDGAFAFSGRTTVDDGARLLAAMRPHHDQIFRDARGLGRREPQQAYALDALIALAGTDTSRVASDTGPSDTDRSAASTGPRAYTSVSTTRRSCAAWSKRVRPARSPVLGRYRCRRSKP